VDKIPKEGKRIIGKSETTQSGRASLLQRVTSKVITPISEDFIVSSKKKSLTKNMPKANKIDK
jgi:hypothetical protein